MGFGLFSDKTPKRVESEKAASQASAGRPSPRHGFRQQKLSTRSTSTIFTGDTVNSGYNRDYYNNKLNVNENRAALVLARIAHNSEHFLDTAPATEELHVLLRDNPENQREASEIVENYFSNNESVKTALISALEPDVNEESSLNENADGEPSHGSHSAPAA